MEDKKNLMCAPRAGACLTQFDRSAIATLFMKLLSNVLGCVVFLLLSSSLSLASIHKDAERLKNIFSGGGHHDFRQVTPAEPLFMVHDYLLKYYGSESEMPKYQFVSKLDHIPVDELWAGTLLPEAALNEAVRAAQLSDRAIKGGGLASEAQQIFYRLFRKNAVFGFNGLAQNGCAAATAFLLIIDPVSGTADGIDLYPCEVGAIIDAHKEASSRTDPGSSSFG
jgi:hypothetical protein